MNEKADSPEVKQIIRNLSYVKKSDQPPLPMCIQTIFWC